MNDTNEANHTNAQMLVTQRTIGTIDDGVADNGALPKKSLPHNGVAIPTVNFYILSDSDIKNRLLFIVKLVEKAQSKHLKTAIVVSDEEQLTAISRLLWTANPASFLAHEILAHSDSSQQPLQQSSQRLPNIVLTQSAQSLISGLFTADVVIDVSYDATPLNFPKVMLIANQHPDVLANSRMKYQSYVTNGIKPAVHKIGH